MFSTTRRESHTMPVSISSFDRFLVLAAGIIALLSTASGALAPRHSLIGAPPRCAGCNGSIHTGSYIEALGQSWHPEHFGCTHCGTSFNEGRSFIEHGNEPYCEPCYHGKFAEKCQVCRGPLIGRYYETFWGEKYCADHRDVDGIEECSSCRRPICDGLTGGGVRYNDGRPVCNVCRDSAVDGEDEAKNMLLRVKQDLERIGFDFGPEEGVPLSFRLVDQPTLEGTVGGSRTTDGITHTRWQTVNGKVVRSNQEIHVLHGLPRAHFGSVAAHELGHVYIFRRGFPDLSAFVEEGLCELLSCAWLRSQQMDPDAEYRIQSKVQSDDPIYGGGLRAALDALKGSSTDDPAKLFEYVRQHGCFPDPVQAGLNFRDMIRPDRI